MFELWVTQGQGGVHVDDFGTLDAALEYIDKHKKDASFAVKNPDGTWHKWGSA